MWFNYLILTSILLLSSCQREPGLAVDLSNQNLTPIPFNQVVLKDSFWKPRLKTQMETLVPFALDKTKPAVENLQKAAHFLQGIEDDLPFPHRYISSDLYKVMEGAAYLLMEKRDPTLENRMDSIINIIGNAQKEDGYLYVAHTTGAAKDHAPWGGGGMGDKPYSWVIHSHELYNIGHMIEAAIAYYRATGKDKWLNIAQKSARHINTVFFEGDPNYNGGKPVNQAPGHQELELALAKLFRVTNDSLYLYMAKQFLDIRGVSYIPEGEQYMAPTYSQQHLPIIKQNKAIGHAVRAAYMYAAMAEVDGLTKDTAYQKALDHIWHNIVDTRMHITGGLGAVHGVEGFGPEYFLPNKEAYNETCAAVGNVLFNYRMFLASKDAKFMDIAEVALFNNVLAGVNLDGNEFFYVNPLEADGQTAFNHGDTGRSPWFNTACCPSNLARLIPQVPGMMYAHMKNEIYVHLFASSQTEIPLHAGLVRISQESAYPFEGEIRLKIEPAFDEQEFTLKLRIPTWAQQQQFVPGGLYDYIEKGASSWSILINGKTTEASILSGFAEVNRKWQKGDEVVLRLPLLPKLNRCIDKVEANKGKMAVTRGPLVYCAESYDNELPLNEIELSNSNYEIFKFQQGALKEMVGLDIQTLGDPIRMIPYFAWNNRGDGAMKVWFPVKTEHD